MARLEDIHAGTSMTGLLPMGVATVESVQWIGQQALKVIFRSDGNQLGERLLYRDDEPSLDVVEAGRPWSFDGDGELLRLVSEAYRINLAWLFDPYVAITTSLIEPLPHQIAAVYQEMLPRQPMRFLLADDPGAGKTIMAGLFIKELKLRGDLQRCLIVSPGSLTDQWQDELWEKFGLDFDLLTRDMIHAARSGNPFEQSGYLIARMDQLARNEELQDKLADAPEWDLVIVDEAHRMSGHFFGNEIKLTRRYKLGLSIGSHCRNFLLMTATPHNGKEEDFQIFLALLDGDRFEGKFRDGVHTAEPSDLMRRLVKEDLFRFDGKPLFPERCSYTVQYDLSPQEAHLYSEVTDYVREEMNRAERFVDTGEGQRRVNVGFALMILQRRLASSPESIYRSLTRRRERLESRLREERLLLRGKTAPLEAQNSVLDGIDEEIFDEAYDEAPQEEREELEAKLVDNATAAATIEELEIEIEALKDLQDLARAVVRSGQDAKWNQLNSILDDPLMIDDAGHRRKLVIFSEFRDTLAYLGRRIRNRLGRNEAVVEIHGSVTREERRRVVHAFMNDPEVLVLIANDAAGEGVNLQRAHLMVNYDLPWNPNRLEQRFGRIHRIGQHEVCHLWNLIAKDTREGDVYVRLLEKLEVEREALGGKVYDVLGRLFDQKALRELLMDAIRYGNDPEVKARLDRAVEGVVNRTQLEKLLDERALVHDSMDTSRIQALREEMERAHARRLQPHFVQAFFLDAFRRLGGKIHRREDGRFVITHVPAALRERDRHVGQGAPVLKRYERVCFEKDKVDQQPRAELVCPGNPLLCATIDLVLERHGQLLKRGSVLVDEADSGETPRLLFYLEHSLHDGRRTRTGELLTISKRMHFVEVAPNGPDGVEYYQDAGTAPYLDYRPIAEDERALVDSELDAKWLRKNWDNEVMGYAITQLVPHHVDDVRGQRLAQVEKTERQVKARLTKEIAYWDRRAQDLKDKERAGKPTRLPARVAQDRADTLADRLQTRLAALEAERHIMPAPPRVTGGSLIIPGGLLRKLGAQAFTQQADHAEVADAAERKRVELLAMDAVMAAERALGRHPRDVSAKRGLGYDIESKDRTTGELFFIEVKGRQAGANTVTLTKNEILAALNSADRFRLAIVEVDGDEVKPPVYVQGFDFGQPGFAQTSASFDLAVLKASARKKSIRHGHPSTLHLWWARRPLAACRAVLFGQLVDDPSAWPKRFRTEAAQDAERQRIFRIIEDLVVWENSNNEVVLDAARQEIARSYARGRVADGEGNKRDHAVLAEAEGADAKTVRAYLAEVLPPVHDPFAGGGSIPLEAQRLGLRAIATDLNPVAVMINKALIEIPPKFAERAPVGPPLPGKKQKKLGVGGWPGATGLAEDVRRYGAWMREEAFKRIGHLYPKVTITEEMAEGRPDLEPYVGQERTVIAWLWARTVASPNPAFHGIHVPLVSNFFLSTKKGKETWIEPVVEGSTYHFEIRREKPDDPAEIKKGTKLGRGANFGCIVSGTPIEPAYIKAEGKAGRMSTRLMAVVLEGNRTRLYVPPTAEMEQVAASAKPEWRPGGEIARRMTGGNCTPYGLTTFGDLFTPRQLVALTTFSDLVLEAREKVIVDAKAACWEDDERGLDAGGTGATAYGEAVGVLLGLGVSKMADAQSSLVRWMAPRTRVITTFSRHALPMVWDFAESSAFAGGSGDPSRALHSMMRVVDALPMDILSGAVFQATAQDSTLRTEKTIVSTDPPYYDNIGYADLSDYFYVWMRRSLRSIYPKLFGTMLVPKATELVATPYRHGGKGEAEAFFLDGMTKAVEGMAKATPANTPVTIYYAFKQSELKTEGVSSTGWETFLDAVLQAGFSVTGTWPVRTERDARSISIGTNALASSIVLVCRKRPADAPTITRGQFRRLLASELPEALKKLQKSHIAPVDLAQASIGPGMAVFSRHAKVLEADGSPMSIRSALQLIHQVMDEIRGEEEGGLDPDTRFAITWFESHGFEPGPYGDAETLAKARAVSVSGVQEAGVLHSAAGKVRLLQRDNLPDEWDPAADKRLTVWEATQHLIKRLDEAGETGAARLLAQLDAASAGIADKARDLSYRLYTICERRGWAEEARAYNGLVIAWPELTKLAGSTDTTQDVPAQAGLFE